VGLVAGDEFKEKDPIIKKVYISLVFLPGKEQNVANSDLCGT
jgi:hypothetical protein